MLRIISLKSGFFENIVGWQVCHQLLVGGTRREEEIGA
jgi:hypothetical protein